MFSRTGTTWSEEQILSPGGNLDYFGSSVAISGDGNTIAGGAVDEDSGDATNPNDNSLSSSGAVWVFARSGGTWIEQVTRFISIAFAFAQ